MIHTPTEEWSHGVVVEPTDVASRWRYRDLVWEHQHPWPVDWVATRRASR